MAIHAHNTLASVRPAAPAVFDPAAYVADLRKAGFTVTPCPRWESYFIFNEDGFGEEWTRLAFKWADAREADPDHAGRTFDYLMAEG